MVFKNCETRDVILEKFVKESAAISCIKKCVGGGSKIAPEQRKLFDRQIDVQPILEPDEIIWENLAFTGDEQRARRIAINIFSVIFLVLNTIFTMYLAGVTIFMNKEIPAAVGCPEISISKVEAYKDFLKDYDGEDSSVSTGMLGCYCKDNTSIFIPWKIAAHNFVEFSDLNTNKEGNDRANYCLEWWGLQYLKEIVLFFISTSAVFINELVANFF